VNIPESRTICNGTPLNGWHRAAESVYNDAFKPSVDVLGGQWSQSSPKTLIPSVSIRLLVYFKWKKTGGNYSGPLNKWQPNGRKKVKVNWISSPQWFNHTIDLQPEEISRGLLSKVGLIGKMGQTGGDSVDASNHFQVQQTKSGLQTMFSPEIHTLHTCIQTRHCLMLTSGEFRRNLNEAKRESLLNDYLLVYCIVWKKLRPLHEAIRAGIQRRCCEDYTYLNPKARLGNRNARRGSLLVFSGRVKTGWSSPTGPQIQKGAGKTLRSGKSILGIHWRAWQ